VNKQFERRLARLEEKYLPRVRVNLVWSCDLKAPDDAAGGGPSEPGQPALDLPESPAN
jgi:hypothetical protein